MALVTAGHGRPFAYNSARNVCVFLNSPLRLRARRDGSPLVHGFHLFLSDPNKPHHPLWKSHTGTAAVTIYELSCSHRWESQTLQTLLYLQLVLKQRPLDLTRKWKCIAWDIDWTSIVMSQKSIVLADFNLGHRGCSISASSSKSKHHRYMRSVSLLASQLNHWICTFSNISNYFLSDSGATADARISRSRIILWHILWHKVHFVDQHTRNAIWQTNLIQVLCSHDHPSKNRRVLWISFDPPGDHENRYSCPEW